MGKSVDFCHIIIISAIITVYRTARDLNFLLACIVLGEKIFHGVSYKRSYNITKSCYELSSENTPTDREH